MAEKFYLYKHTDGKWYTGEKSSTIQGKLTIPGNIEILKMDSNIVQLSIVGTGKIIFTGLVTDIVDITGNSIYSSYENLITLCSDFFRKAAAGISSGVEVVNALGYTPAALDSAGIISDSQNTKKVSRKGDITYHLVKCFTPNANQTITISADGLKATLANPMSNFQFTSAMVNSLLEINPGEFQNIISSYISNSVVAFAKAWPNSMRGQVYTYDKWGIYGVKFDGQKFLDPYFTSNQNSWALGAIGIIADSYGRFGNTQLDGNIGLAVSSFISWTINDSRPFFPKDTGLKKASAGVIEINDGNTAGVYRDLNLRNLNYTGSLTNTSDERLKKNLRPVTDGLKKVIDIAKTIRHYEFIDQDAYGNGVITSEIAQYLLELGFDGHVKQRLPRNQDEGKLFGWEYEQKPILNEKDEPVLDGDGNQTFETVVVKEGDLIYTVDSQALTIYLFPAIVELNERIISIEERLNKAGL